MSEPDIYYEVSMAPRVREHLDTLEARAAGVGRQAEFTRAIDTIETWLRADPTSLGEPVRDHLGLRLTEYTGSYGPFIITYGVHWDERIVFVVRNLRLTRSAGF
jgi:hypothetical protein